MSTSPSALLTPEEPVVWRRPADVPSDDFHCVAAVGVFDGVHRGHRAVVERAQCEAQMLGLTCVVITFDPHPLTVLAPARAPLLLTNLQERAQLITSAGADAVYVQQFDLDFAATEAEEFIDTVLVELLGVRAVVVGDDFRVGRGNRGDVQALRDAGATRGYKTVAVPLVKEGAVRISSTLVRSHVREGRHEEALTALGRRPGS